MDTNSNIKKVVRTRKGGELPKKVERMDKEPLYRGFGSIRGEIVEEFHDRMFDLDPLEAMIYEMEFELARVEM